MDYDLWWKTLETLLIELKEKGVNIPGKAFDDLKSAKTLMNIFKVDKRYEDSTQNIENYLRNVESHLLYLAENSFGKEYTQKYLEKIDKAQRKGAVSDIKAKSKFISGVPRGEHWVRIKTTDLIEKEQLERIIKRSGLSYQYEQDEYFLVSGDKTKIKDLLNLVTEQIKRKNC